MSGYRIGVMDGDGIGPEVVRETVHVLEAATYGSIPLELVHLPVGLDAHRLCGFTLPPETIAALETCDGWVLGPLSTHEYEAGDPRMVNASGALRKRFDLFANIRPIRSLAGAPGLHGDVDLVIVRENTEGMYADRNVLDGNGELRPDADTVISVRVVTRKASERIARAGFELARRRAGRRKVTLVHNAKVLRRGCGLFLEACQRVAAEYPDISVDSYHVDAMAMRLVMRPQDFDVIVTTNLFGDVLSDEAAGLVGGLGLAPGLNAGDGHAMAQAVHGSAPDLGATNVANPIAEILSGGLLLDWLGRRHGDPACSAAGARIERAVTAVIAEGGVRTCDLGGCATTRDMGSAVVAALERSLPS